MSYLLADMVEVLGSRASTLAGKNPRLALMLGVVVIWLGLKGFLLAISLFVRGETFPTIHVSGTLTVSGDSPIHGFVAFTPLVESAGGTVIATVRNGDFSAPRVPACVNRVVVEAVRETGAKKLIQGVLTPETVSVVSDEYRHGVEIDLTQLRGPLSINLE